MSSFLRYIFLLMFSSGAAVAQNYCGSDRFTNKPVFRERDIESTQNVAYAYVRNWKGEYDSLRMDFYYPNAKKDSLSKRPFVLLIHPGGFMAGKRTLMTNMCKLLAQRGFVTATIQYRLGWYAGSDCNGNVELLKDAVYRAVQDARAALRYTVAHAREYKIDTAWIFIGGSSAGGATAMQTAFCTQEELDDKLEMQQKKFGPLDSSGNTLKNNYTIKGTVNMWGGMFSDLHINNNDKIPTIMFHGDNDEIVPFYIKRFSNCYSPVAYPIVHGSRSMANRFKSLGICYELNWVPGGVHGVYDDNYIADRTACFFRNIICKNCSTAEHTFSKPDCSNK